MSIELSRGGMKVGIRTYCSPTESCTGPLWSYSDLHNNDPEEDVGNDERETKLPGSKRDVFPKV